MKGGTLVKKYRFFALSMVLCLSVLTLSGCAQPSEDTPASQPEESASQSEASGNSLAGQDLTVYYHPVEYPEQSKDNDSAVNPPADFTHTAYPPLDAFTLQVELQSDTLPKGETFVLECSLKNDSGENYYLQQLPDFIGYTYNDYSEYALALGDFTYFRSGEEITRLIEIPATESGTITITADFDVCLSPGSQTSQPYQYIQDFEVTVE